MARRLRQVVDLYTAGKVAVLKDGSPIWVQALNPFEHDTARNEAQIAKARITMAIKEFGSAEQEKVRMFFFEDGIDEARAKVVDAKVAEALPKLIERLRNDPEWSEKLDVLERGLEDLARVPEESEIQLLEKLSDEYTSELGERLASEREFLVDQFADATEDALWDEYLDWYMMRRASEVQLAEYRLHQVLFGVRWCEGELEDGHWRHDLCDGHRERVFHDKEEVRQAPEELIIFLMTETEDIEVSVREAKNLEGQGSSSDSSPLPREAEESTASIPEETPPEPPGSSSSPSDTPSPSLDTAS